VVEGAASVREPTIGDGGGDEEDVRRVVRTIPSRAASRNLRAKERLHVKHGLVRECSARHVLPSSPRGGKFPTCPKSTSSPRGGKFPTCPKSTWPPWRQTLAGVFGAGCATRQPRSLPWFAVRFWCSIRQRAPHGWRAGFSTSQLRELPDKLETYRHGRNGTIVPNRIVRRAVFSWRASTRWREPGILPGGLYR